MLPAGKRSVMEGLMATRLRSSSTQWLVLAALLSSLGGACGTDKPVSGAVSEPLVAQPRPRPGRATPLAVTTVSDPLGVGEAASTRGRAVIRTAAQYRAAFGHDAPADVRFADGEVVIFYAAGTQPAGGYVASIVSVVQIGRTLSIATHLSVPGEGCVTTEAETMPYALVKVTPRGRTFNARFQHLRSVVDCPEPPSGCDGFTCPDGQHCELQEVVCVTEPCNPVPTCVDDEAPPFCGGIAGFPCPGDGECVDDPSDDCDPEMGGADCGGLCTCAASSACKDGEYWNGSPAVCACQPSTENPCNLVDCVPGTTCEVQGGEAVCVPVHVGPNPCAFTLCPIDTDCQVQGGEAVCVPTGAPGGACGAATCAAGTVCCNASCGICTPPDGACIQIAC